MYTVGHSRLISIGLFLPEQRITSQELMGSFDSKNRFGVSCDWLERTTGIKERRIAPESLKSSDLATKAAQDAMERAHILPNEIDAIIYCGVLRDHVEPATAHIVQHKIGAKRAIAIDVSNACLGFMNGIHLMDSLIATGQARRGLVVTGERGHHYIQKAKQILSTTTERAVFADLAAALTLGDAGAAAIMGPKIDPETGFLGFMVESHGEFHDLCICGRDGEDTHLVTKMAEIVKETTRLGRPMTEELMQKRLKWHPIDLKRYIPHQVGLKSIKIHAEVAKISPEIIPITVDHLGNIISATIPVNLALLTRDKELKQGDKVYLSGTGSGISLCQAGLIWDAA